MSQSEVDDDHVSEKSRFWVFLFASPLGPLSKGEGEGTELRAEFYLMG